jgi:Ca2+-binding EF-hand superfamily protein
MCVTVCRESIHNRGESRVFRSAALAAAACLVIVASTLFVSRVVADEKPETGNAAATFAQLDANKDGQLSADEIRAENKRLFERLLRTADKNKDARLSLEEFSAGLAPEDRAKAENPGGESDERRPEGRPAPERMFRRLDANRDGKVTLDEVPEPRREGFKRLIARGDKDGDSALSAAEFSAAFGEMPENPPIGKRPEGQGDAAALFARLDKNGDGKLTVDETPDERRNLIARMLRRADKDSDQALSLAEFLAGRERPDQVPPVETAAKRPGFSCGLFGLLDTDHDGKLVESEIAAAGEILRKLDKNNDAVITLDEIFTSPGDK